jgi:hypothetical protein
VSPITDVFPTHPSLNAAEHLCSRAALFCLENGIMVSIEQCVQIAAPIQGCFDLSRSIEVHLPGTERTG